ncbi:MAG: phosphoribosylamine--glycine ligase [Calditrichaeota bacterium]|nr:phosphoribosylamine--glycine ligase [Calditrichota bacterium]
MKVVVIGSGGREHALCWALARSRLKPEVHCLPGNGGTHAVAHNEPIPARDFEEITTYLNRVRPALTVIGPDDPIAAGLGDLIAAAGHPVFAPSAAAARIEFSKAFAKDLMVKAGVPTAGYQSFTKLAAAESFILQHGAPVVVKASGLALGKGAVVCYSVEEAIQTARIMLEDGKFGEAGSEIVVEDFLPGREVSLTAICDGTDYLLLPPSRDHKRARDGDEGPNTGGMGVVAPLPDIPDALYEKMARKVVSPVLKALADLGTPFRGFLYPGLMVLSDGSFAVLEINARLGDPEAQALLPLLKFDLLETLLAASKGELRLWMKSKGLAPRNWRKITKRGCSVAIVAASRGYPGDYQKGIVITSLPETDESLLLFHAGTKAEAGRLLTAGGRVLACTGLGDSIDAARQKALAGVTKVKFDGAFHRIDIGLH